MQKNWPLIERREDEVHRAIVVKVSDRKASRVVAFAKGFSRFGLHGFEHPVTIVAQQQRQLFIFHVPPRHLDHLIKMSVHDNEVENPVIIIIEEVRAPAHVRLREGCQMGANRPILIGKLARIDEDGMVLIVKIRHHESAVFVVSNLGVQASIFEGAVVPVDQQQVRGCVPGNE